MKILRKSEVCARTGLSDTTLWRRERDGTFPKRAQLGPQAVGWFEDEIDEWLRTRKRGIPSAPLNVATR
jgi:prophage regulatory protein